MHTLYRQLCDDHRNMQRLLDAFDQLLRDLSRRDRDPETLSLILDALDYISIYPDRWHHPVEDLAMKQLLGHADADREAIEITQREHRSITATTRRMNALFYAVANDAAVERSQLFRATRDYLQLQRAHMQRENERIFPQFASLLTAEDWALVEAQLKRQQDPLFSSDLKRLYESLHHYIVGLYEPKRASA
ncbi:hemerythrin HHE cation-binding protein [Microbulbifer flavimaris]|uniref:Hemerythrin HHE cation-binding protein n=1 Tax=Microbulbifer flavimaris TaxID=1781068 RepID=A0ABX4HZX7_9GAMM|nr:MULTISPECIES: hemerythrin domain-containing protein [Microbulbifer]KUJ83541.1 hemerythrin HHE cation-binding protein [Microbulbifer sp. ZGT114]PCO05700.1 hemerythrin HHE cation-binding protein [Microbulbifer flavimaris]